MVLSQTVAHSFMLTFSPIRGAGGKPDRESHIMASTEAHASQHPANLHL